MTTTNKLLDLLWPPAPPPPGGFRDDLPEAFGALDADGEVYIIGYRGRWFSEIKPTLWVRVHNMIVSWLNRREPRGDS